MGSNSEIQGYNFYPMLHFRRKFSSGVTAGRPLIEEFKRGLNRAIRRKLAEAEELPTTIGEWQERVVRLDRNQRQSRAEERMLGRNAQPRGGYGGGLYRGRGGQIMWRAGNNSGAYRGPSGPSQNQMGPRRDPNAMDVDKGRRGDRTCYVCVKWGHMAKNFWER